MCALVMFQEFIPQAEFARLILHECLHAHQQEALSAVEHPDMVLCRSIGERPRTTPSIVENRILCSALQKGLTTEGTNHCGCVIAVGWLGTNIGYGKPRGCLYMRNARVQRRHPTYVEVKASKPS